MRHLPGCQGHRRLPPRREVPFRDCCLSTTSILLTQSTQACSGILTTHPLCLQCAQVLLPGVCHQPEGQRKARPPCLLSPVQATYPACGLEFLLIPDHATDRELLQMCQLAWQTETGPDCKNCLYVAHGCRCRLWQEAVQVKRLAPTSHVDQELAACLSSHARALLTSSNPLDVGQVCEQFCPFNSLGTLFK